MAKKKMTILDFQKFKDEGRKFAFCTAYDYTTATIVDESDVEIILVGDSLGMIMLGYDTTVPVTVDDMIHHIKPVVKGAPNTFIIGDMPFGSYNVSPEQAIETANRLTKETLCDCVKLEGGVNMAPTIRRMVDGMYGDFKPKFVKQFANVRKVMVDGLNKFHEETLSGEFPTPEFSFNKAVEIPAVYGPGKN